MWGALLDGRTGLPFTTSAGPHQRSHSWVWVPQDSWSYIRVTVSASRLPQPQGQGPHIYIPQEQGGPVIPPGTGFPFVASYESQGYGGGIRTRLHARYLSNQVKSSQVKDKVTMRLAVSQSVSLGDEPHLGLMTRYLLPFYSYGLALWGALSDERTGLSFLYAASPRQRSLFRVRVPWDSWSYFTVSDSRLPFPSPPTARRATVEVFDSASTRGIGFIGLYQLWLQLFTSQLYNTNQRLVFSLRYHFRLPA
jgi:hypothetical protein